MKTKRDYAMELFDNGHNCSQAILMAFADDYQLEPSIAEKLSVAFGGGMSKQGKACGCLSGALMVIGLQYGKDSTKLLENRGVAYNKGKEFIKQFEDTFGAIDCKELIRLDLNRREDLQEAMKNVFGTRCKRLVGDTAEMIAKFLPE